MIAVMYHFVGDFEKLRGISLEKFKQQLDFLQKNYSNDQICLTFDHGTIDHFTNVAYELEERGLKGLFFIITIVQEEHRIITMDKQRFLEADYRFELARMVCRELSIDYKPKDGENYLSEFYIYSLPERYLRFLRDTVISPQEYGVIIGNLFNQVFGNEKEFCLKKYLSWGHVCQLQKRGHIIGSHSHAHYGDEYDYKKSLDLIYKMTGEKSKYVSYPNGVKRISDAELEALGVTTAFISRENGCSPYKVARVDCNQFNMKI